MVQYIFYFNSIKVQLKRFVINPTISFLRNFNSIKVQLKRSLVIIVSFYSVFQFHKGTIKAPELPFLRLLPFVFQFHKGTIKAKLEQS